MKKLIVLAALSFSHVAFAQAKLAVVDLQRALEETDEGKKAKAKLKSDFDKKQKELDDKQEELKKMKDDFDKKASILKDDAKQAKAKELQDRFIELQQTYQRLQQDLAKREQEATSGIFRKLQTVVSAIAEKERFDVVLEKSTSAVWSKPELDITNEVIRRYNAGGGGSDTPKKK